MTTCRSLEIARLTYGILEVTPSPAPALRAVICNVLVCYVSFPPALVILSLLHRIRSCIRITHIICYIQSFGTIYLHHTYIDLRIV